MMDLDYFKQINDVYGHPAGDSVLKFVAELLVDNCRASDTVCRYGGEEFCVMLPETGEEEAAIWAERARSRLAALSIPAGLEIAAHYRQLRRRPMRDENQSCEELVNMADQALLCSKHTGRDRVIQLHVAERIAPNRICCLRISASESFENVCARDVLTPLAVCLQESDSIDKAASSFLRSGISGTPILDADGMLAGFLSEKDLMTAMTPWRAGNSLFRKVMRTNVICYEEDTPIRVIYDFLCRGSLRCVVIVKGGRPLGTICRVRWCSGSATGSTSTACSLRLTRRFLRSNVAEEARHLH